MTNILQSFSIDEQIQDEWCWAAVAVGIDKFYNPASPITQCTAASQRFPGSNCCRDGSSLPCNSPVELQSVPAIARHLKGSPQGPLSVSDVTNQIQQQQPICVGYRVPGDDDEHFVVIKGIDDDSQVLISDPQVIGDHWVPFTTFQSAYRGFGIWTNSFLTQK